MIREFSVVIEKDEDGYFVASVPALRGCHTQAKSLDVLMKRVREAIALCLYLLNKAGAAPMPPASGVGARPASPKILRRYLCLEVQEPVTSEFVGVQRVAVMA